MSPVTRKLKASEWVCVFQCLHVKTVDDSYYSLSCVGLAIQMLSFVPEAFTFHSI